MAKEVMVSAASLVATQVTGSCAPFLYHFRPDGTRLGCEVDSVRLLLGGLRACSAVAQVNMTQEMPATLVASGALQ